MPTNAYYGGLEFQISDNGSPETFAALEEISDVPGIGESLELIEATHFGSGGSKEYIAGLADGQEFTVTCNHVIDATQQLYVKNNRGITGNIRAIFNDGNNSETYDFAAVFMGWELAPSVSDKNSISFTFKISGGITQS